MSVSRSPTVTSPVCSLCSGEQASGNRAATAARHTVNYCMTQQLLCVSLMGRSSKQIPHTSVKLNKIQNVILLLLLTVNVNVNIVNYWPLSECCNMFTKENNTWQEVSDSSVQRRMQQSFKRTKQGFEIIERQLVTRQSNSLSKKKGKLAPWGKISYTVSCAYSYQGKYWNLCWDFWI